MKTTYRSTYFACYFGYIIQALVNTLAPLLFVIFQKQYAVSTITIGNLIFLSFAAQWMMDLLSVKLIRTFGYRTMTVAAYFSAAAGLVLLGVLPLAISNTPIALGIAISLYAFGSGIIEVTTSPIISALPGKPTDVKLNFLHFFFCLGQVLTVVITTVALLLIGDGAWHLIPIAWAILPLCNAFLYMKVPFAEMISEEESSGFKELFSGAFPWLMVCMVAAGATEMAISQWASLFAETALGISKTAGDLFGPCLFAVMMGLCRILYGIFGEKINVTHGLFACGIISTVAYLLVALAPSPWVSLLSCGLCGFGVGLMWPGTVSKAEKWFPKGGTLMFSMLAFCGDGGCSLGPWVTGLVSGVAEKFSCSTDESLKLGVLLATVFPLLLTVGSIVLMKKEKQYEHGSKT